MPDQFTGRRRLLPWQGQNSGRHLLGPHDLGAALRRAAIGDVRLQNRLLQRLGADATVVLMARSSTSEKKGQVLAKSIETCVFVLGSNSWLRTENTRGSRKKMIVTLARKLLIALWRFAKDGVVPQGVVLRSAN